MLFVMDVFIGLLGVLLLGRFLITTRKINVNHLVMVLFSGITIIQIYQFLELLICLYFKDKITTFWMSCSTLLFHVLCYCQLMGILYHVK